MYVRLNANKNIVTKGKMHQYKRGDIVDIGRQMAQEWVKAGEASLLNTSPDGKKREVDPTAGVLALSGVGPDTRAYIDAIGKLHWAYASEGIPADLPFTETLILNPTFMPRVDLLVVGFNLLKKFQMAVPIRDYKLLASQIGTEAQREQAVAVLRDLRVPLRDTRLVFMRRCSATKDLMKLWSELTTAGQDERLAFMMAFYTVKPLVCDLPASWSGG